MNRAPWEPRTFWNTARFDPVTAVMIGASALGTIVSAGGQLAAGDQQKQAQDYQSDLAKRNALAVEATSQRQAVEERRKAAFAVSRARALAAASGGGATDPTVLNVEAGIGAQGEYNALSRLFTGSDEATNLRNQARLNRYMGQQAQSTAGVQAVGTIIGGIGDAAGMYAKYG